MIFFKATPGRLQRLKKLFFLTVCLALIVFAWRGLNYIHSKRFCVSCHSMAPFSKGLARDPAHHETECLQCHIPVETSVKSFALLRQTASDLLAELKSEESKRYHAVVTDDNCLQAECHQQDDWDSHTDERTPPFRTFRHTPHLDRALPESIVLKCTYCHTGIPVKLQRQKGSHFGVNLSNCFPCHRDKTVVSTIAEENSPEAACLVCHPRSKLSARSWHILPEPVEGDLDTPPFYSGLRHEIPCNECHNYYTLKPPVVEENRCRSCHDDLDEPDLGSAERLHADHVIPKKADCVDCHQAAPHRMNKSRVINHSECAPCHKDSKTRFEVPVQFYMGRIQGFKIADPMSIAGVTCRSCHTQSENGCSPGKDSCKKCHVHGYEKLVAVWQKTIKKKRAELDGQIQLAIEAGLFPEVPPNMEQLLALLDNDGSHGVHNIVITQYLLSKCSAFLQVRKPQKPKPEDSQENELQEEDSQGEDSQEKE